MSFNIYREITIMKKYLYSLAGLVFLVTTTVSSVANAVPLTWITFSEFAVGTVISDQYADLGVLFSKGKNGNFPVIADDSAMDPGSPVLSPNPPYAGDFDIEFLTSTTYVEFLSGYWDAIGTAKIDVFDWTGNLSTYTNIGLGQETFTFANANGVRRIVFDSSLDPAGGDIDNLKFNVPAPASLLLLSVGLLSLGAFRRGGKRQ
jgi:hypothetical protein